MNAHSQLDTQAKSAIVLFGKDEGGKAHASAFSEAEADLARKAAALMGMSVLTVATDAELALAAKLPKGRIFASGKGFVPFVAARLFAEIAAVHREARPNGGGTNDDSAAFALQAAHDSEAGRGTDLITPSQPNDWSEILIGTIVLAAAAPLHTQWFECLVVGDDGHDVLTLRYADWPQEPPFERHRNELAIMHPSRQLEPPVEAEQPAEAA